MALGRAIDVVPRPRARRPDVPGDLHAARVVERAGAYHDEAGIRIAVAVDRRAALAAEMPAQGAAAVRGGIVVALSRALRDLEAVGGDHGVDGAAGAGSLLAVYAVAGAQAGHGGVDGVADGTAEAAAGKRSR